MKSGYTKEYKFDVIETGENNCQDLLNILESEEGEYISTRVKAYCDMLYNIGAFVEDTLFREKYPDGMILEEDNRVKIIFVNPVHEKIEDGFYRTCKYILVKITYQKLG